MVVVAWNVVIRMSQTDLTKEKSKHGHCRAEKSVLSSRDEAHAVFLILRLRSVGTKRTVIKQNPRLGVDPDLTPFVYKVTGTTHFSLCPPLHERPS